MEWTIWVEIGVEVIIIIGLMLFVYIILGELGED